MFVRNIITDVIAILKHPQFRPAAGLCRYALPLLCWHTAVEVIDGVLDRNFVVKAQWKLEFHLSLTWAVDGQHRHPSPQKVIAIHVQFFFHRIQSRDENHYGWPGSMPRFAQDAGHSRASLIRDSYTFAWEVEKEQRSLIVLYKMFVCHAQLTRLTHKHIL